MGLPRSSLPASSIPRLRYLGLVLTSVYDNGKEGLTS
jgi:hypothetical protein